MRLTTHNQQKP